MRLVVDTNILVSFFRDNPVRTIILNSELVYIELYTPEYSFKELLNIKKELSKYSKQSSNEVDFIFEELKQHIKIIPDEFSKVHEEHAKLLSPHDKDIPFFALAIKFNCSIWSNELAFKEQDKIKVFNTQELRAKLSSAFKDPES